MTQLLIQRAIKDKVKLLLNITVTLVTAESFFVRDPGGDMFRS